MQKLGILLYVQKCTVFWIDEIRTHKTVDCKPWAEGFDCPKLVVYQPNRESSHVWYHCVVDRALQIIMQQQFVRVSNSFSKKSHTVLCCR